MIADRVEHREMEYQRLPARRRTTILRLFNWAGLGTYLTYFWGLAGGWRMPVELTIPLGLLLLLGHCYLFVVLRR